MMKNLGVLMGECDSLDEVIELLRMVTKAVLPDRDTEAIEKAAEIGSRLAHDIETHQFLKHADVSAYNKTIAKAFPEQVEEKKQECSQADKADDKHKE